MVVRLLRTPGLYIVVGKVAFADVSQDTFATLSTDRDHRFTYDICSFV
jgi:hypothetical protein